MYNPGPQPWPWKDRSSHIHHLSRTFPIALSMGQPSGVISQLWYSFPRWLELVLSCQKQTNKQTNKQNKQTKKPSSTPSHLKIPTLILTSRDAFSQDRVLIFITFIIHIVETANPKIHSNAPMLLVKSLCMHTVCSAKLWIL